MNEHDRDLILGLADGSLTGDDAAAARARVEADPALAEELALQTAALSRLQGIDHVPMTSAERTTLRATLREQLHLDDAPEAAPAPVPVRRRTPWWQPVLGVAAVAVFVMTVIILPGGGSDDSASEEALVATTMTASADSGSADSGGAEAPPSTIEVSSYSDVDGSDLLAAPSEADTPEEVSESLTNDGPPALARSSVDLTAIEACLEQLGRQLPDGGLAPIGVEETEQGLLVFFAVLDDEGVESVVTVNLDQCRIVDVDQ